MNTPLNHRLAAGSLLAQARESQAHVQLRRGDPALEAACLTRHAKVLIRTRSSVLCPMNQRCSVLNRPAGRARLFA